jgi:2'-hydroxyisoflavone reductase
LTSRRDFLRASALIGGAVGAGFGPGLAHAAVVRKPAKRALRILVLGGTGFIGPHLVRRIVERGHTLSIFTRGRSEPGLYPEAFRGVENLVGDRNDDLSALAGREWDAVIDNSGYTPEQVGASARLLAGSVGHYLFTSTRGVYADYTHPTMDESAPLGQRGVAEDEWEGYGPLKALSEAEVQAAFPGRASIVRPPIITGPLDRTDRFTYWYERVDRGGEILAPGNPSDPIQYVDVRDLVDFFVHMAEENITGVYNTVAPAAPLTTGGFLHGLRALTAAPVSFTWVGWDFLEARGLEGGASQLPAWRRPVGDQLNYGRVDNSRAIAAGMTFRPLATTASDTLSWWKANGGEVPRVGLSREREAEVLEAWRRERPASTP